MKLKALPRIETVALAQPKLVSSSLFGRSFHVYPIKTTPKISTSEVVRRYSHFVWLRNVLVAAYPSVAFRGLPPKDLQVLISKNVAFLESRRSGLEKFLQSIVRRGDVIKSPAVGGFLSLSMEKFEEIKGELETQTSKMCGISLSMSRVPGRRESKKPSAPMPSEAEVNKEFEAYLAKNKGLYKPEAEDNMRKVLPAKQKWQMVCEAKGGTPEEMRAEVKQYISALRGFGTPNQQTFRDLRAVLRSRDKSWIGTWFELGGPRDVTMVLQTCPVREVQTEAVETLYRLINIRFGMDYFCANAKDKDGDHLTTITALALSLPKLSHNACQKVLQLLCACSEEHPEAISTVFQQVFRSKPRFWVLVDLIANSLDYGVKLWALALTNSIINSIPEFDKRIKIRRFFIDQDIDSHLDSIDMEKAKEKEVSIPLAAQIDLYHEAHREDRNETTRMQTDLSDPISVMRAVHSSAIDQGCGHLLLSALHSMLLLPSSGHGEVVWQKLDWFLNRLTAGTRAEIEGKDPKIVKENFVSIDYKTLGEKLERQEQDDMKWKNSELKRLQAQMQTLEEQLAAARVAAPVGIPPPPVGIPPPPGTAGIPPAPGGAGISPPPGGIPPPPGMAGIPAPPGGIPPPPGMGPGLGLPPPPGMAISAAPAKPKCPAKKKIKPGLRMKPLHWAKINNEAAYETVWKEIGDEDAKIISSLDVSEIETQFGDIPKKKAKVKKSAPVKKAPKKKLVQLLDGKRRQAVDIALRGLKLTGEQARDAMLKMNRKLIPPEALGMLTNCCPNAMELDLLKSYSGPTDDLANAEGFMRVVSIIPNLTVRLQLWSFKDNFQDSIANTTDGITIVNKALRGLDRSSNFKKVLQIVLALGNYINGSTKKGAAWGFKLSSLGKLKMLRANDGKHNLMHFIVTTIRTRFPGALKFLEDLETLESASYNDTTFLAGEALKLESGVRRIGNEIEKKHFAANDKFVDVMASFHKSVVADVKKLVEESKKMKEVTLKLCKQYGEKKQRPEELLQKFAVFIRDFNEALRYIDKEEANLQDKQRRQRGLEEQKRKREAKRKQKEKKTEEKAPLTRPRDASVDVRKKRNDKIVDMVVNDLTKLSARDMLRKLKKKRHHTLKKNKKGKPGFEMNLQQPKN
ncbi:hypothetical protein AAMO2058_000106300 [Amorphochlora amoebiformis]